MPSAASLISKVEGLLKRFNATDRVVYKRTTVREGGDPLIGSPASVTATDVEFDPQPAVLRPSPNDVLVLSGFAFPATDYRMIVSPNMMSLDDLGNKDLSIVLKDISGAEETLFVAAYAPIPYGGTDVYFSVLLRSKKR